MNKKFLIAVFDDEHDLIEASQKLKEAKVEIVDFYTPFPVHGLDELLGINRTRLPYVTAVAGAFGLILAMGFQIWTSAFDWPINVGGKPMLSIPAFAPVAFEMMVLFGALTTVAAFFYLSKLYPSQKEITLNLRQLDDKFVALVNLPENKEQAEKILADHRAQVSYKEMAE